MQTPAEIKKEIATRLKQARENAGFVSAEEFCEKNNVKLDDYVLQENGERSIKASTAQQYCKLLNISLNWLLLGDLLKT